MPDWNICQSCRILIALQDMVGARVYYQDAYLGIVRKLRHAPTAWSHSPQLVFILDNGHWLRDFRNQPNFTYWRVR